MRAKKSLHEKIKRKIKKFWQKIGPGIVTGASDDDPSGIATYSQAGAVFGFSFLWTALLTFPLMYGIQEMCARIAIVSSKGLTTVIKEHYPRFLVFGLTCIIIPAIIINIAADLAGMGAVANLLFPGIPKIFFNLIITGLLVFGLIVFSYEKIAQILKYSTFVLLSYFVVPFLVIHDWSQVAWNTFVPSFEMNQKFLTLLVAVLGTTISPYLFFWQTSMSLEHHNHGVHSKISEIRFMKIDVSIGMLASNLAMFFIILTTGAVLFPEGINDIETVEQAAEALKPLAGELAYLIFTIGVLGVGFIALPVLGACVGYIFAELFNWKKGLDKKFNEAPEFYSMIVLSLAMGFFINFFGIDPIRSLIVTAIVYGMTAPIFIAIILHICNTKAIMGRYTNTWVLNMLGGFTFLVMTLVAIALVYISI